MEQQSSPRTLDPLDYHKRLVDYLRKYEPNVWDWSQTTDTHQKQAEEVRDTMLRHTYRLEPSSHPDIFDACTTAMTRLGIDAPVTLYQANDGTMNASLFYIPGEVHLVFYGPILERLKGPELLALMGHELAHYQLWSADDGAYFKASQIVDHALTYPDSTPSHRETARLFSLHTELFADRGSALVAGEAAPAISVLVKVMTGLSSVDPAAYLRQAEELEAGNAKSEGISHPEAFLRARALDMWWREDSALEDWLVQRIHGPLSIEALDLLRQQELTAMTRAFFARFLAHLVTPADEVMTQIKAYFPDFQTEEEPLDLSKIAAERIDDPTRDYFVSLMFDCAMADPDSRDDVMLAAARSAEAIGAGERFKAALRRDLKWTKRDSDKLMTQAAKAA